MVMFSRVYPYGKIYQRVHFCPTLNMCSLCQLPLNKAVRMLVGKKKRLESVKVTLLKIFAYKAKECKPLKKKKKKKTNSSIMAKENKKQFPEKKTPMDSG